MSPRPIDGLHHVTAITGSAQRNVDFWARSLGLRFVKRTVNFDDPGTYHLYYGNEVGAPGTAMTYFAWETMPRGRSGTGETSITQLSAPRGSLDFWERRLTGMRAAVQGREEAFGEKRLLVADPDGLVLALVERDDPRPAWTTDEVGVDTAIRGFRGVTLRLRDRGATSELLTGLMNYAEAGREGMVTRYVTRGSSPAGVVDIQEDRDAPRAAQGAGSVHHVAFAVPTDDDEAAVRAALAAAGFGVTPVIDRTYFRSIYFRSPGGVLFEIATQEPGFTVDEAKEDLGRSLKLPPQHEHLRAALERNLPPLTV